MQYEQCEQEMQRLQELIEGAHREIEGAPVATSNIQELQAQISRHEVRQEHGQDTGWISNCDWLPVKERESFYLFHTCMVGSWAVSWAVFAF